MSDAIKRLRELEAAATKGPWRHWWCGDDNCDCHALEIPNCPSGVDKHQIDRTPGDFDLFLGSDGEGGWSQACGNVAFIAAARNALPLLLDVASAAADTCACGARGESPDTHPHVTGCRVGAALARLEEEVGRE